LGNMFYLSRIVNVNKFAKGDETELKNGLKLRQLSVAAFVR